MQYSPGSVDLISFIEVWPRVESHVDRLYRQVAKAYAASPVPVVGG